MINFTGLMMSLACVASVACASLANAEDATKDERLIRVVCGAGRLGIPLQEVADYLTPENTPTVLKNVYEGCRQESVRDLSCYPFTITPDGKSRVIYMPGTEPSDARNDPLTADCKGRVGRWPAWRDAKEDKAETYRMGVFYANNPPGELPPARPRQ